MATGTIDIEIDVVTQTNTGRTVEFTYCNDYIPCYVVSNGFEPDYVSDTEFERCYDEVKENMEDNLTLDDMTTYAIEHEAILEDEEIISWKFKH